MVLASYVHRAPAFSSTLGLGEHVPSIAPGRRDPSSKPLRPGTKQCALADGRQLTADGSFRYRIPMKLQYLGDSRDAFK